MILCKRKKEEEAVTGDDAFCVISKAPEGISVDIPQRKEKKKDQEECSRNGEATMSNALVSSYQDVKASGEIRETCKRKKAEEEAVAAHASCGIISKTPERSREKITRFKNKTDQQPMKECDFEQTVITTGTASKGTSIGVVDIGVNKAAYFFQVALPGVSKHSGEFSCEIKSDGKVILEGSTTTGGKTIKRHSRVFKMNIKKLCPPGPFKLSFSLPGPVDPRLFSPNFRSDGIFEAIVIRQENSI